MASRNPTPTVLASQGGYSPPPPVAPSAASDSFVSAGPSPAFMRNLGDIAAAYGIGKHDDQGSGGATTAQPRQPLQESTGNAQYHHQHTQFNGYPSNPYYHLPSMPSTRSSTPLHLHGQQHQHQFGGPLGPPPPPARTPPAVAAAIVPSNDITNGAIYSQHQHSSHHAHFNPGSSKGPSPPLQVPLYAPATTTSSLGIVGRRLMYKQLPRRHPFYDSPEFATYREKQKDGDRQKWPEDLELYFLDAIFLIPKMGRRKYYMYHKPHGRNMIISIYIWLRWKTTQPNPETIERVHNEKLPEDNDERYHKMFRKRKQVSSHIQVLKGFYRLNVVYHFIFCKGEEGGKDKGKNKAPVPNRWYKDNTTNKLLKEDPILSALEKGQLPALRPNYEYFHQLLAMNKRVQIKLSACWIYVGNKYLRDEHSTLPGPDNRDCLLIKDETKSGFDGIKLEDSHNLGGYTSANPNPNTLINTYHNKTDTLLFSSEYPHRYAFNNPPPTKNNCPPDDPWVEREAHARNIRQTLLHEYTFKLKQTESSSAREVLDEWLVEHEELHDMLQLVIKEHDLLNAHTLPDTQLCDIIHVDVTMDIHRVHSLPEGTSFEWPFKIDVTQPELQGHDWNVRTHFDRPVELARRKSGKVRNGMVMTTDDQSMMNEMTHVRGCSDDNSQCICRSRHRGPTWLVLIPVNTWAETLDMCAQFPRYLVPKKPETSRTRKEEEMPESDTVTQMDLMKGTAMFQELWSSAPVPLGGKRTWTRRAVICWTFNTTFFFDKPGNICETPAQTTWRFLTALDPLSEAHQSKIYLPALPDDDRSVMTSAQDYHQLLNDQIPDHLSMGWHPPPGDVHSAPASMPVSPLPPYCPPPIHVSGNFTNGLVTPPASATLPSTYTFEGLPNVMSSHALSSQHLNYLPVTTIDNKEAFTMAQSFNTDSYLQGPQYQNFYPEEVNDNGSDTTLAGESADINNFDTQQWSQLNSSAHAVNASASFDWSHNGLHSLSMAAEGIAAGNRNPTPDHLDESVQQHLPPYADLFTRLNADGRERRAHSSVAYEEQRERNNHARKLRRGMPRQDDQHDGWTLAESPSHGDQALHSQNYSHSNPAQLAHATPGIQTVNNQIHSQDTSVDLSQSTMRTQPVASQGYSQGYSQAGSADLSQPTAVSWTDELSQVHHSQAVRDEGLTMPEPRALQGYASASLSPLLNRKRHREDDKDDHADEYPAPSYASRGGSSYAPAIDRGESHGWP